MKYSVLILLILAPYLSVEAQGLDFYFETTSGSHNDTVSAKIKTNGFRNIVSLQFSIHWDPEQIQYVDSHSFFPSSLPVIGDDRTNEGQLLLSWVYPQAGGQILPDSSSLFELSFLVKACPGESLNIALSSEPLPIEVFTIVNDEYFAVIPELFSPDWPVRQQNKLLGPDTLLCVGEKLNLEIPNCANCEILWSTGSNADHLEITESGTYSVSVVTAANCILNDSLEVRIADSPEGIVLPYSLITPNGDHVNDELCFEHIEKFEPNKLVVFNRWGQVVFQQLNYQNNWSGTHHGKPLPEGIYYYILSFSNDFDPIKSTITILR